MTENKLASEVSPYLLQHKNNPVNWFPWGKEALEKAKSIEKPILLSIGYSSCHWCHVMAHESFEDEETAELMNELFINIKIDREERPELDEIYLQAVQIMSGHGGWPLTVFLTPELKPFFGGTYFPLEANFGQPSFKDVLIAVSNFFNKSKQDVYTKSEQIHSYLKSFSHETSQLKLEELLEDKNLNIQKIAQKLISNYNDLLTILESDMDKTNGGFGHAPKFPQPSKLSTFLFSENPSHVQHAIFSLVQICRGGITDQIGGGIARYSVDEKWLVPHFEKMLYDNAQILPLLAAASIKALNTENSNLLRSYAYGIYTYLERDLKSLNSGLYFSSEDADSSENIDSEGEEGLFYTFLHEELAEIFPQNETLREFAEKYYKVTVSGNFEGTNILTAPHDFHIFCDKLGISISEGYELKEKIKKEIFTYRSKRIRPGLDDKCILAWNALLVKGLLQSSVYLNDRELFKTGLTLLKNLLKTFKVENKYYHSISKNKININAFADDIAFLLEACCEAFFLTGCANLLEEIKNLSTYLLENFCDQKLGLMYYSEENPAELIHRPIKNEDNVIYSANSAIVGSFVKIKAYFNKNPVNEKDLSILENVALISLANSAVLANKVPVSSAKMLQEIKWLEKEKMLFIDNKNTATDFLQIAAAKNKYYEVSKEQGEILISCSLNILFSINDIENYANKVDNKNTDYLYCDRNGCYLPVKNISELIAASTAGL